MTLPPDPDAGPPLDRLRREPWGFDFFQAVRLLEAAGGRPVGGAGPPAAEAVRFAAGTGPGFPAAAVEGFEPPRGDAGPPRLVVTFFGLTGPNGVLPAGYTQAVAAGRRGAGHPEGQAAADWFDLFTHRLLSLFHRAWAKYRLPAAFETAGREGRRDPVTGALLALIGLGTPGLGGRLDGVDDLALLRYANLLAGMARPAGGLAGMLSDYFGVPVAVEAFAGRRVPLDAENQSRLGRRGANDRLGDGVVVGRRVWDVAGRFRVRVGPLDGPAFAGWLPAGRRLATLAALVRFATRDDLDFDVQVVLAAGAAPPLRLARHGGRRLGWDAWVARRPPAHPAGDAVFRPASAPSPAQGANGFTPSPLVEEGGGGGERRLPGQDVGRAGC